MNEPIPIEISQPFISVTRFENQIAKFFGAPFAVAVDSCTHGLELCLRYTDSTDIYCPKHTYLSIPMLANKLKIYLVWWESIQRWKKYYWLNEINNIIDAAVLWEPNSYIPHTFMCISFQYQKHLSLGRGGMILTDNEVAAGTLRMMAYDGRLRHIPWRKQNVCTIGYHYYMPPETAMMGLKKLPEAIAKTPRIWTHEDYPDLTQMKLWSALKK